jgi:hypothetical protein
MDLGPDDYNLPGYFESPRSPTSRRWTYYRLRTEGHNTLTLGGQNQDPQAAAPLVAFGSASSGAFAVADLIVAYRPAGARRVLRGVALRDDRSRVLVQDEIESEKSLTVRWAMHTRADVRIVGEGGGRGDRAVLSLGGAMLEVRLLAPATARFAVGSAQVTLPQRPAPNVHVLEAQLDGVTSTRLAVLFTPLSAGAATPAPALAPAPALTALERWRA